jgi:pyruvate dehydrogenase E2 component (dihydrolipoamide acetyltransferase)
MTIITPITMPKFGLAMTEGKLAGWSVPPGSAVSAGQEIADIETSKITNGYESPASGVLRRQVASEGETLPVGALIGVLAGDGTSDAEIDAFIEQFQSAFSASDAQGDADAPPARPTLVDVDGLSLQVQDMGQGNGLPVLLIHGFGGDLTNWLLNQDVLAAQRRVVAFDLPGHGGSTKEVGDGTPTTLAAITARLLETLGIERAHVVGHSLGGAIALELARAHPDKVASLGLIAPAGLGPDINMDFIEGFITADRRKTLEPVLALLVNDPTLITRNMVEGIIRFKRLDGARQGLETIAAACFPDGRQKDGLRDVLNTFSGPVQVIWGEADKILSPEAAQGLPASITVTRLPQTGHMPQMEKATQVNDLLTGIQHDTP